MAMLRYGAASVVQAHVTSDQWTNKVYKEACVNGQCRMKTAKSIIAKFSPDKYLLSHCFPAGHKVLMADGTEKVIEKIQIGDLVITHAGNIKPVTKIMSREVDEDLVVLKSASLPETSCTSEHPFYSIKRINSWCKIFPFYAKSESVKCTFGGKQKCKNYNCSTNGANPSWSEAKDLKIGDRTYTPTLHDIHICSDLNPNRLRLLGYYVAEGRVDNDCWGKKPYMIRFSIHRNELPTLGLEIARLMKMEFGIETYSKFGNEDENGVTLSFHSFEYAPWFLKHAGLGSRTKKLSIEIMTSPVAWQEQLIGAWLNGDGCYDKKEQKWSSKGIRLSTSSEDLASQAVVILDRLEIHSILRRVFPTKKTRKKGPYSYIKPFDGWHVCIPVSYATKLTSTKWDIKPNRSKILSTKERYRYAASTLSVIKSISKRRFSGTVYNLSVENDESYVINRQAVHNCTIIASVDVELANPKDSKTDYFIHPEFSKFVNNNGDAWTKGVLKNAYKTFVGGENYLEHVQIPELSKGKIIDAAPREIVIGKDKNGKELTTHYIDILVATDRKHEDLIRKIESKELNSLSMGCLIKYSICSKCGRRAVDETEACEHVRFQKNNMFFDDNGIQRKIAELCGHESEPDSVKFIEASWVRQPAFTGAVLRSFVEPSEEILAKIEAAKKMPAYKKGPKDYLKAAADMGLIAAEPPEGKVESEPKDEEDPDAPEDTPPPPPPEDETPAEDAPAEDVPAEAPVPEMPAEDPETEIQQMKKDLKKKIFKQVQDDVMKDLSEEEGGDAPRGLETLDETLIKPASLVLAKVWGSQKTWDRFVSQRIGSLNKRDYDKLRYGVHIAMTNTDLTVLKDYGYSKRDFLAVLSFIDSCFKVQLPMAVKKTIASIGGTQGKTPVELLQKVVAGLGRKVTAGEATKILSWLRLLDFYS